MYGMMATNIVIPEQKKRGGNTNCADITKYFANPKIIEPSIHNAPNEEELHDYFKRSCAPLDLSQPGNIYQREAIHDSSSEHQVELSNKWQTGREEHECDNMMKYVYKDDMNMERIERQIFQDLDSRMCHGLEKSVEMVQNANPRMYENALTIKYGREMKLANEMHNNLYGMPQEMKQDVINDKAPAPVNNAYNMMLSHSRPMHNRDDMAASMPKHPAPNSDCLYSENQSYKWGVPDLTTSLDEFKLPENELRDQRQDQLMSLVSMDSCPASLPMESCNRPTDPLVAKGNMYISNEIPPQNNTPQNNVADEQNVQVISYEEFLKSEGLSVPSKDKSSDPNVVSGEPVIKKQSNIRKFFTRVPRTVEVKFDHKRLVTVTAVVHPQPQSPHKLASKKPIKKHSPRRLSTSRQQSIKHSEPTRTAAQFSYNMRRRKSNVVVDIEEIDLTIKEFNSDLPDVTKKPWRPGRRRLRSCQSYDSPSVYDQAHLDTKTKNTQQEKHFNRNIGKNLNNNWTRLNAMYPKPQFLACDLPSPKRRRKKRSKSESCKDELDSFDETPAVIPFNNIRKSRILYNCRKSARLNPDINEGVPASDLENSASANHLHKPLRSIYKSTVIQKDATGLKLKFTRIGKKRHHHHHQHERHKKHKSAKVQKAMELLQRAKESSIHRDTRIDDGLRRSTRQSSVMVRKAMEGARKAEELRQARITAQRLTSPRKRLRPRRVENNSVMSTRANSRLKSSESNCNTVVKDTEKLASIFTQAKKKEMLLKQKKIKKVSNSPADEAKQLFLRSGIPQSLQQQIAQKQQQSPLADNFFPYPAVSHVDQKDSTSEISSKNPPSAVKLLTEKNDGKSAVDTVITNKSIHLGSLTTISGKVSECYKSQIDKLVSMNTHVKPFPKMAVKQILVNFHCRSPKIPIGNLYRNYLLKCQHAEKVEADFWARQAAEIQNKRPLNCVVVDDNEKEALNSEQKRQKLESSQNGKLKSANGKKNEETNSNTKTDIIEQNMQNDSKLFAKSSWLWTTKYQPTHSSEIIGNQKSVQQLKTWLMEWKEQSKYEMRKGRESVIRGKKNSQGLDSDEDSDFALSVHSDDDDDDYGSTMCNTVLLTGPVGIGKTASVYAIADELGYKVFEVNGSSRRTGKLILSDLKEATQSHQVASKGKQQKLFSQANKKEETKLSTFVDDGINPEKKGECTTNSNSGSNFTISLVLFEDVDLVFDNDDGFWSAVNTLMSMSKRPIILTSSSQDITLYNKIKGRYEELKFQVPNTRITAMYLQILCLVENLYTTFDCIHNLVLYNEGNIRRSMLELQFWALSGGDRQALDNMVHLPLSESSGQAKAPKIPIVSAKETGDIFAENSTDADFFDSLEFPKDESTDRVDKFPLHQCCFESICGLTLPPATTTLTNALKTTNSRFLVSLFEQCHSASIDVSRNNLPFLLPFPSKTLLKKKPSNSQSTPESSLALNKTKVLDLSWISDDDDEIDLNNESANTSAVPVPSSPVSKLTAPEQQLVTHLCKKTTTVLSQLADNLSELDSVFGHIHSSNRHDCWKWWYRDCTDGLSNEFDENSAGEKVDLSQEIGDTLVAQSLVFCSERLTGIMQDKKFQDKKICKPLVTIPSPLKFLPRTIGLYERSFIHHLDNYHRINSHLSPVIQLNHNSFVVDYLPHLRRVCQSEKCRQLSNTKRGGRFLHYLDAMSLPPSVLDYLSESSL